MGESVERSDLPEGQHNASDLESPAPTFKESAETLNKRGEAAQQSLSRGARALRYPEDSPRFDFWLLAEPPYDLFDDLHAARIERALDDFEARVRTQVAEDLRRWILDRAAYYSADGMEPNEVDHSLRFIAETLRKVAAQVPQPAGSVVAALPDLRARVAYLENELEEERAAAASIRAAYDVLAMAAALPDVVGTPDHPEARDAD